MDKYKKCKNVEGETQERKIPKFPEKAEKILQKVLYALTAQEKPKKRQTLLVF